MINIMEGLMQVIGRYNRSRNSPTIGIHFNRIPIVDGDAQITKSTVRKVAPCTRCEHRDRGARDACLVRGDSLKGDSQLRVFKHNTRALTPRDSALKEVEHIAPHENVNMFRSGGDVA